MNDIATSQNQKHVLVVESEDQLANALAHVITGDGHRCARLAPGDAIYDRVERDLPDLVMLDMDRSAALAACQTIRRNPALAGVKILMVLDRDSGLARRRGIAMGANGFVSM
ncbi:MAG: response regulator, partial [Mangrovicoccus sp.]